jgi:hypothetical protein
MSRTNANLPVSEADALRAKLGTRTQAGVAGTAASGSRAVTRRAA